MGLIHSKKSTHEDEQLDKRNVEVNIQESRVIVVGEKIKKQIKSKGGKLQTDLFK